ncbi:MAG: ArsC/Spx/MgsR family protein [SAR324 cluster bacterium]|nr:ArsC/Spx/MgsR family protein [SAR324 cluster bacterium]
MQLEFFEKPGCIGNKRQKELLKRTRCNLVIQNILTYPFTPIELLPFFIDLPQKQWFNSSAPQVKSGEIIPENLTVTEALEWMIKEPILIKRPLLRQGEKHFAGFDSIKVERLFGIPLSRLAEEPDSEKFAEKYSLCTESKSCPAP